VGAMYGASPLPETSKAGSQNLSDYTLEMSQNNLSKTLGFLNDRNVDIVAAAIFDHNQPTCVVFDPRISELKEASPGVPNPDAKFVDAQNYLSETATPLRLAFDLTCSMERAPILLNQDGLFTLQTMILRKSPVELVHALLENDSALPTRSYPSFIEAATTLSEEYIECGSKIVEKISENLVAVSKKNLPLSKRDSDRILTIFERMPIHVGTNADIANAPLVEFIDNKLFKEANGGLTVNFEGLQNFRFPDQPYDTVINASKAHRDTKRPDDNGRRTRNLARSKQPAAVYN